MLHIALFEPEIPENTGNIARLCVGMNATLHLIRPYGFFLNDKQLKRSGVDSWQHLKLVEHDSYSAFIKSILKKSIVYYITRYGTKTVEQIKASKTLPTYFIFGKESSGIPKNILKANKAKTIRIPMSGHLRSLNLANSVAIIGYEYLRQNKYPQLFLKEKHNPTL